MPREQPPNPAEDPNNNKTSIKSDTFIYSSEGDVGDLSQEPFDLRSPRTIFKHSQNHGISIYNPRHSTPNICTCNSRSNIICNACSGNGVKSEDFSAIRENSSNTIVVSPRSLGITVDTGLLDDSCDESMPLNLQLVVD